MKPCSRKISTGVLMLLALCGSGARAATTVTTATTALAAAAAGVPETPPGPGAELPLEQPKDDLAGSPSPSIDTLLFRVSLLVPGFGGLYLDQNHILKIYLLDTRLALEAKLVIAAVFGRDRFPLATAQAIQGRYDFAQLLAWHERHRLTTLAIPGVVLTAIDKVNNRLRIGVAGSNVIGPVQKNLTSLGVPLSAAEITVMEPIQAWDTLHDTHRPLIGGLEISGDTASCTLGVLAVRQAQAGFLTAAHCTGPGEVWSQATISGDVNRVGIETFSPAFTAGPNCPSGMVCRFSDVAFIARNGGPSQDTPRAAANFGQIAIPDSSFDILGAFTIAAKELTPVEGDFVSKVGMASGMTGGTVVSSCTDIQEIGTNRVLFCQALVQVNGFPGEGGDSGAVAFLEIPAPPDLIPSPPPQVVLAGIVNGGNSTLFDFSPMSSIQQELGPLRTFLGEPGANSPPEVKIRQPLNGATVGVGGVNSVPLQADVVDYEGCCKSVTWTSNVDGVIGQGASTEAIFTSPGTRKITVTATDNDGGVGTDSITLTAATVPPSVSIVNPANAGVNIQVGLPFAFKGTSSDFNEPFLTMPCANLSWTSSNAADPFPVSGCTPQITFQSLGQRTITLSGIDSFGLTAHASTTVQVVPFLAGAPNLTILKPGTDDFLPLGTPVTLLGAVSDPGDPNPIAYEWDLFDPAANDSTVLGTGTVLDGGQPTLQWTPSSPPLFFTCGERKMVIQLSVTNYLSQNNSIGVEVFVLFPTC